MKKNGKKQLISGASFMLVFVIWTWLIQKVDVQPVGQKGTDVGFATFNCWFHKLTGVHMGLYTITDWLGGGTCICLYRIWRNWTLAVDKKKESF